MAGGSPAILLDVLLDVQLFIMPYAEKPRQREEIK